MVSKVVELMCAADFEEDEILIHQGAEGDAFYVMECGAFDISVMKQEEEEEEVEEGDHLIVQQKQNKLALTLQASLSYEVHAKQQQTQPYYDTIGAMDPPIMENNVVHVNPKAMRALGMNPVSYPR
eukprot:528415_1